MTESELIEKVATKRMTPDMRESYYDATAVTQIGLPPKQNWQIVFHAKVDKLETKLRAVDSTKLFRAAHYLQPLIDTVLEALEKINPTQATNLENEILQHFNVQWNLDELIQYIENVKEAVE